MDAARPTPLTSTRSPFDPAPEEMQRLGDDVVEFAVRFVEERYSARATDFEGLPQRLAEMSVPPPEEGTTLEALLQVLDVALTKGVDTANPGFAAYVPGGGLYSAALADFLACVANRYTGLTFPAPLAVQLEASVLRWFCDLFALPPTSQGVLTPGGSMSTLSALVAARHTHLGEDFQAGTVYVSEEVHHSVAKAARIAGLPARSLRTVATDGELRLDVDALRRAIAEDRAAGSRPFLVVASAGTVNTGAVDPLAAVADVAADEDLWLHVDAAYGGFFQLTSRGRGAFAGIERADSITLDPHKSLFLPYGTGCLLVRDGNALRAAHEGGAHYLPPAAGDALPPDFASFTPELTRDFRGLRLWLPLHLHGVRMFADALDEKLDLARMLHTELSALPELEVPWQSDLSLLAFRPRNATEEATKELLERVNSSGRVLLSSAPVRGRTYIRICLLSHRTGRDRAEELLAIISDAVRGVSGRRPSGRRGRR